jgi:hypothetical protein
MYQNRFKTNEEKLLTLWVLVMEVPNSLTQLGYKVTLKQNYTEKLENFDVVMTGVRAYNTNALVNKQAIFLIL